MTNDLAAPLIPVSIWPQRAPCAAASTGDERGAPRGSTSLPQALGYTRLCPGQTSLLAMGRGETSAWAPGCDGKAGVIQGVPTAERKHRVTRAGAALPGELSGELWLEGAVVNCLDQQGGKSHKKAEVFERRFLFLTLTDFILKATFLD